MTDPFSQSGHLPPLNAEEAAYAAAQAGFALPEDRPPLSPSGVGTLPLYGNIEFDRLVDPNDHHRYGTHLPHDGPHERLETGPPRHVHAPATSSMTHPTSQGNFRTYSDRTHRPSPAPWFIGDEEHALRIAAQHADELTPVEDIYRGRLRAWQEASRPESSLDHGRSRAATPPLQAAAGIPRGHASNSSSHRQSSQEKTCNPLKELEHNREAWRRHEPGGSQSRPRRSTSQDRSESPPRPEHPPDKIRDELEYNRQFWKDKEEADPSELQPHAQHHSEPRSQGVPPSDGVQAAGHKGKESLRPQGLPGASSSSTPLRHYRLKSWSQTPAELTDADIQERLARAARSHHARNIPSAPETHRLGTHDIRAVHNMQAFFETVTPPAERAQYSEVPRTHHLSHVQHEPEHVPPYQMVRRRSFSHDIHAHSGHGDGIQPTQLIRRHSLSDAARCSRDGRIRDGQHGLSRASRTKPLTRLRDDLQVPQSPIDFVPEVFNVASKSEVPQARPGLTGSTLKGPPNFAPTVRRSRGRPKSRGRGPESSS